MSVRDSLNAFIQQMHSKNLRDLRPDQSLIGSGRIDSLAFFSLVLWIERETGSHIDLSNVDVRNELDTIDQIVAFVEKRKGMK
jgi:acyl carrier protein